MAFESIDEFKKFADKEKIACTDEELKQVWSQVQSQNDSGDGALDDGTLDDVVGGVAASPLLDEDGRLEPAKGK